MHSPLCQATARRLIAHQTWVAQVSVVGDFQTAPRQRRNPMRREKLVRRQISNCLAADAGQPDNMYSTTFNRFASSVISREQTS